MANLQRKRLLLVKGSFEPFGGGERDLINNLEAWSKYFDLSVATLHPNKELIEKLNDLKIEEFREKELKKIDRNIFFRKK